MHFDTDSFLIGINTFASITIVTHPEHFDDLILTKKDGIVEGIEGGLAIKGKGTFKFNIEDDHGKVHHTKFPAARTYLVQSIVSCHRNIGRRRQRTSFLS